MSLCDGILTVFEVTPTIQEPVSIKLMGMQNIFLLAHDSLRKAVTEHHLGFSCRCAIGVTFVYSDYLLESYRLLEIRYHKILALKRREVQQDKSPSSLNFRLPAALYSTKKQNYTFKRRYISDTREKAESQLKLEIFSKDASKHSVTERNVNKLTHFLAIHFQPQHQFAFCL